jgi:predicted O-methyltransferase YrrM
LALSGITLLHLFRETQQQLEQEMLTGHLEGQVLKMLVRMTGAKRVLDIGMFTGYSALAMAEALPDDGCLVACEIDPNAVQFAQSLFERSPHNHKIVTRLGAASDTLDQLIADQATFDFAFIDADKAGYVEYYETLIGSNLLAANGYICADNTLFLGDSNPPTPANRRNPCSQNRYSRLSQWSDGHLGNSAKSRHPGLINEIALPFNLAIVFGSLLWRWLRPSLLFIAVEQPKTILIAGGRMTKALQLARSFHAAGHRAILIDTEKFWHSGNQYSNTVAAFYTVPNPATDLQGYIDRLQAIAHREKVDLFIPVAIFTVLYYDGMTKHPLADYCEVCHFDAETIHMLDDKFTFAEQARSLDLTIPKTYRITSPAQVLNFDFSNEKRQYVLKSIPYDAKHRLDLTKLLCETPEATAAFVNHLPISEAKPWILQEFIPGQEYCTHSTVRDGRSTLYCCCQSSAFQVNYQQVDKPEIAAWVERSCRLFQVTGRLLLI